MAAPLWLAACSPGAGPAGVISQAFGQVTLQRGGESGPAQAGAQLRADDRILTGAASGCEILLKNGVRLRLGADSEIAAVSGTGGDRALLQLKQGAASAAAATLRSGAEFSIATPTTVAAVRGTKFLVRQTAQGSLTALIEGQLEISDSDGRRLQLDGPSELRLQSSQNLEGAEAAPLSAEARALYASMETFPPVVAPPAPAAPPIPDRSASGIERPVAP